MSGIINDPAAAPEATGLSNPLLKQVEAGIEAKLKPETLNDYNKVVVAGMHIALAKGADGFMGKLHSSNDPIGDCAKGAAQLVLVMSKESKGELPLQAGIPAGISLMLHGLDFIDRTGAVKIAEAELDRATTVFSNELFHRLGITPKMLETATTKVHGIVSDPDAMAKINLKAGLTKHPQAAEQTPIEGAPPL